MLVAPHSCHSKVINCPWPESRRRLSQGSLYQEIQASKRSACALSIIYLWPSPPQLYQCPPYSSLCLFISNSAPCAPQFLTAPSFFLVHPNFWLSPLSLTKFLHLWLCPSSISVPYISVCTSQFYQCPLLSDQILAMPLCLTFPLYLWLCPPFLTMSPISVCTPICLNAPRFLTVPLPQF